MNRKKELKELYKTMKPDMGVFIIKVINDNKSYIEGTGDLKASINSTKFKLNLGSHPNKELQKQWKEHGESGFTIEILEELNYDEDESKTDYSDDLNILKLIWEDRLSKEGIELF
ncbi:GIY-YIG nuclease family protein [Tissierella creatinini]|nr:GIY-YIG nuclease family protein [Tissierella creatinini]TJX61527.1 GIY-YIG nuclease family protein [Soehngenia saccharolytica]